MTNQDIYSAMAQMITRFFYLHIIVTTLSVGITLFIAMQALDYLITGTVQNSKLYVFISIGLSTLNLVWLYKKANYYPKNKSGKKKYHI